MPPTPARKPTLNERMREELVKYLAISAYLYVCFGAIALYKSAVLRDIGIAFMPFGLAAVKALIVGKFLLLGHALGAGTRLGARGLGARVVLRTLGLLAVLMLLMIAEELLAGAIHGKAAAMVFAEFIARWPEHAAMLLLVALILLPPVTAMEMAAARGVGVLEALSREVRGPGGAGRADRH